MVCFDSAVLAVDHVRRRQATREIVVFIDCIFDTYFQTVFPRLQCSLDDILFKARLDLICGLAGITRCFLILSDWFLKPLSLSPDLAVLV